MRYETSKGGYFQPTLLHSRHFISHSFQLHVAAISVQRIQRNEETFECILSSILRSAMHQ